MSLLKNKIALVTGGGRGIGKGISLKLAEEGAKVIVCYNYNSKAAEEIVARINNNKGLASASQLQVENKDSVKNAFKSVKDQFGNIDILVNNAGINKPNDFDKISEEDWDDVLDTNLKGPFLVSQSFLPIINKGGSIINIASVSGQYGGPRTTHYACSKAGLITLTQNLAIFCAKNNLDIRVNCVSPGLIESEMAGAAKGLGIDDKILLGRMGKYAEVADVVAFLASEKASYITAQTINVNGGLYF